MRVGKDESLPSRSYADTFRSHLRSHFYKESGALIDLNNEAMFPRYHQFMKGFHSELKKNGKGDPKHYDPLDGNTLAKIYEFLVKIQQVVEARGTDSYKEKLEKLPNNYHNTFHYLLQYGAQFIIQLGLGRRAREGITDLKKSALKKFIDPETNAQYYQKVQGEQSKNHQNDREDLRKGGIIPFEANPYGLNPGLYIQTYLSALNEKNVYLFQRPIRRSLKFDKAIHLPETKCLFEENAKVGKNLVGKMLPTLTGILGIEHATNHQLRSTAITLCKDNDIEDRTIMGLTGHKSVENLNNYNAAPPMKKKHNIASAIFGVSEPTPARKRFAVPSSTVTSGDLERSIQSDLAKSAHSLATNSNSSGDIEHSNKPAWRTPTSSTSTITIGDLERSNNQSNDQDLPDPTGLIQDASLERSNNQSDLPGPSGLAHSAKRSRSIIDLSQDDFDEGNGKSKRQRKERQELTQGQRPVFSQSVNLSNDPNDMALKQILLEQTRTLNSVVKAFTKKYI